MLGDVVGISLLCRIPVVRLVEVESVLDADSFKVSRLVSILMDFGTAGILQNGSVSSL